MLRSTKQSIKTEKFKNRLISAIFVIPRSVVEKINKGEMTEDEFWVVALEFAKVVSEKARGMFKTKGKYDDYLKILHC